MSTTMNDQTPADRGRHTKPGPLDVLCAAWRRWRARLCNAGGFFTAALTLFAIAACDGTGRTATVEFAATSCPGSASLAWFAASNHPGGTAMAGFAASSCPGSVSLTWFITNASGQFASCAQVGATRVALRLQSRTGGTPVFTAFPCASSPGTANVAPGLYDVAIELHDANGAKLAIAAQQTSVAVAEGRTKVLSPVVFAVGAGGGGNASRVALTLQADSLASNCRPPPSGAGITGTTITLENVSGGCAPVTFVRNRGSTQTGTYQVNCSSPQVASCIESDETLTSPDLTPGSFVMRVRGKIGAADCWAADRQLEVPQVGQLQARIVLQRQNGQGC